MKNKEGKKILEFCGAMSTTVGSAQFKTNVSHLVIVESGSSKILLGYFLVRASQSTSEKYEKSCLEKSISPSISH